MYWNDEACFYVFTMQKFLEKINEEEKMKKPFSRGFYEVNLKHLAENIQKIRRHAEEISGKKMKYLLPVKGNGYGTGMLSTAHFIQKKNLCEYLGVAHMQEAFELRESGITLPILVLGQTFGEEKFLNYISEKNIEIAHLSKWVIFFIKNKWTKQLDT